MLGGGCIVHNESPHDISVLNNLSSNNPSSIIPNLRVKTFWFDNPKTKSCSIHYPWQITDEDKKEEEHIGIESSERMEQEPSKELTPPPPSMPPAPSISQAVSEMQVRIPSDNHTNYFRSYLVKKKKKSAMITLAPFSKRQLTLSACKGMLWSWRWCLV